MRNRLLQQQKESTDRLFMTMKQRKELDNYIKRRLVDEDFIKNDIKKHDPILKEQEKLTEYLVNKR